MKKQGGSETMYVKTLEISVSAGYNMEHMAG